MKRRSSWPPWKLYRFGSDWHLCVLEAIAGADVWRQNRRITQMVTSCYGGIIYGCWRPSHKAFVESPCGDPALMGTYAGTSRDPMPPEILMLKTDAVVV